MGTNNDCNIDVMQRVAKLEARMDTFDKELEAIKKVKHNHSNTITTHNYKIESIEARLDEVKSGLTTLNATVKDSADKIQKVIYLGIGAGLVVFASQNIPWGSIINLLV